MPYLILAIGLIIGIYGLYRFFLTADVKQIKALGLSVFAVIIGIAILVLALTGRFPAALALAGAILPFYIAYRRGKQVGDQSPSPDGIMTEKEALEVLGLEPGATKDQITDSYKKLMMKVHPDSEGSDWMAAKLNQARDTLLK
ncbi:MAG: molecular chaperone DnaJ [Alphaproteobacteria bacterium PRO2]|nr:molecular chaperone DnaJ [Alphaproteobacteria bacterium PRO2]